MKTSLVIMAAGLGSRYGGGIKQMDPLGANGEIMMDYSIFDALEAGFNKIVFIIRRDLDEDFRALIGSKIEKVAEVAYAYQELENLPEGFSVPEGRKKPWGTGQAILAAKELIHEPFAVINADDYYGKEGFRVLHELLVENNKESGEGKIPVAMTAFVLKNTLSANGGVTRGIVSTDENGKLIGIKETKNLVRTEQGAGIETPEGIVEIDPESPVSMNMWGLTPAFLDVLTDGFREFLASEEGDPLTKEYLLPTIIDGLVRENRAEVKVLHSGDVWFGVTYAEDKAYVQNEIRKLIDEGIYRTPLF